MSRRTNLISMVGVTGVMVLFMHGCIEYMPESIKEPDAVTSASSVDWAMNDFVMAPTCNTGNPNYLAYAFASNSDGTILAWKKQSTKEPVNGDLTKSWNGPWNYLSNPTPILPKSLAAGLHYGGKMYLFAIRASDNRLVYRFESTAGQGNFSSTWLEVRINNSTPVTMKNTSGTQRKLICDPMPTIGVAVYGVDNTSKMRLVYKNSESPWYSYNVGSDIISNNSIFCTSSNTPYPIVFVASLDNNTVKRCNCPSSINQWPNALWVNLPPCTFNSNYAMCAVYSSSYVHVFIIDNSSGIKFCKGSYNGSWMTTWANVPNTIGQQRKYLSAVARTATPNQIYVMSATNILHPSAPDWYQLKLNKLENNSWSTISLPANSYFHDNNSNCQLLGGLNANISKDASFYMIHQAYCCWLDVWSISGGGATNWQRWGQLGFEMNPMP